MATLAVALVCTLASFARPILLGIVIILSLVAAVHYAMKPSPDAIDTMGFIKLMFLMPLGLGSLLTFVSLSQARQAKSLRGFTLYINLAVTSNIFIMIFSPDGGTLRGRVSRVLCIVLLVWLLQEMAKVKFQTTQFDSGFFIFRSSPLKWVLAHACYRLALLSLPAFDSLSYLLLEPLSLGSMVALYHLHKKRHPLPYYFGFADTLVVTTLAVLSRYPLPPGFNPSGLHIPSPSETQLDILFLPIQIAVIGFAVLAMRSNTRMKSR
ncbi:MAG TPA: hypothetical protein VFO10_11320 [Oligoflexus sp.]|uniref:hypothetical protein n=1 Tax=Oligoflexus sp. TaxID=1971216 RepID=UPI002D7F0D38|nr:hypothetical protein [Oligoflexus sp.]HET9237835.1 hypothetical protein [Oligoflexus sp.]